MNDATNIDVIGNYRNRPAVPETIYNTFGKTGADLAAYNGYTDADIVVDGSYLDDEDLPASFTSINQKQKLLYSLEDCFGKFRPRSGINKAAYFPGHYSHNVNSKMMSRPRYYIADKDDKFKYWTSFRTEADGLTTKERGVSYSLEKPSSSPYYIDDAAPFITYINPIPINRIVIKTQTHVGTENLGSIFDGTTRVPDPLYDYENDIVNRTVPIDWKIQSLDPTSKIWEDIKIFNDDDNFPFPVINRNGYLELQYSSGEWSVAGSSIDINSPLFTDFNNPNSTDVKYINGLRIVVNTMSKEDVTFDLIELSPRLALDISSLTQEYSVNKIASDLGRSGLPVGQLLVSTGSISIADFDEVLNTNNTNSVIAKYVKRNIQIKFYEIIKEVDVDGIPLSYYVPIKTMYAESFPEIKNTDRTAIINLRDLYFYFESITAPELLITDASFSYSISALFDSIGFTNYIYLKSSADPEPIIPYFYVAPNSTVAEVLQQLAISTQTAMFFDEDNNFVLMSRSYMLASPGQRNPTNPSSEVDTVLRGSSVESDLSNIIQIASKENNVFNDGKITYTSRYIQKDIKEIRLANVTDRDRVFVYRKALLWEVTADPTTKSQNEETASQSAYSLSAIPLNAALSNALPTVVSGEVVDNVIDLGEAIYFLPRYNGYFYSNGEIIQFDAVEYSVSQPFETGSITASGITSTQNTVTVPSTSSLRVGQKLSKISGAGRFGDGATVQSITNSTSFITSINHASTGSIEFAAGTAESTKWINNVEEYQKYFAQIPFNGKMYPTGRVRIFSEPYYVNDTTLKEGVVAKHGRGQFNTPVISHNVGLPEWINTNISAVEMESGNLFEGNSLSQRNLRVTNNTATNTNIFKIHIDDLPYIRVKQKVTDTGIGTSIPADTKITKKIKDGFRVNNVVADLPVQVKVSGVNIPNSSLITTEPGAAGFGNGGSATGPVASDLAKQSTRTGLIRNYIGTPDSFSSELEPTNLSSSQASRIQSSALSFTGPTFAPDVTPRDFVCYTYNKLDAKYRHFGTRMRIIGLNENNEDVYQSPSGAMSYFHLATNDPTKATIINGGSGGIGIFTDPDTNNGYFFELAALTVDNVDQYTDTDNIANILFYKTVKRSSQFTITNAVGNGNKITYTAINNLSPGDIVTISGITPTSLNFENVTVTESTGSNFKIDKTITPTFTSGGVARKINSDPLEKTQPAIPLLLWSGRTSVNVDDGKFAGEYRIKAETNPTVYDLGIEYKESSDGDITFYLYVNNKLVGSVVDSEPITNRKPNVSLFVRGTSKCMFENVFAVAANEASNYVDPYEVPNRTFTNFAKEKNFDPAINRYTLPDAIQDSYLSGISPISTRSGDVYFEEFGTIMREMAYFNIKYDKAYPAFISKILPNFNTLGGYSIGGFFSTAYGAEFLIFNTTDTVLVLDETTGNALRIAGVTFTQQSQHEYTVDEYFQEKTNLSDPSTFNGVISNDPLSNTKNYQLIKNSRINYGRNEFNISAEYLQSSGAAEALMGWITTKIINPRKSLGIEIFANPSIQLGDIVTLDYKSGNSTVDAIADTSTRFVVYNIQYKRNGSGPSMTVYVSEIPNVSGGS